MKVNNVHTHSNGSLQITPGGTTPTPSSLQVVAESNNFAWGRLGAAVSHAREIARHLDGRQNDDMVPLLNEAEAPSASGIVAEMARDSAALHREIDFLNAALRRISDILGDMPTTPSATAE